MLTRLNADSTQAFSVSTNGKCANLDEFLWDSSFSLRSSSILGMDLYGAKFCVHVTEMRDCTCREVEEGKWCRCERKNFDSFLWAVITVFQVWLLWSITFRGLVCSVSRLGLPAFPVSTDFSSGLIVYSVTQVWVYLNIIVWVWLQRAFWDWFCLDFQVKCFEMSPRFGGFLFPGVVLASFLNWFINIFTIRPSLLLLLYQLPV